MGGRSRIRWHKVAKLALAGFGCLALFMGLPSLIRRPEPPPLQPDVGFAHVAAPREPAPSGARSRPAPPRRAAKGTRDRRSARDRSPRGSHRPTRHEQEPPATGSRATSVSAPARVHTATAMSTAAPPPAPTPAPPPAAPSAQAQPSQAAAESEFGFER